MSTRRQWLFRASTNHLAHVDGALVRPHMPNMLLPYVVPAEPTAAQAIVEIREQLEIFDDWMDRYQFIIELGRKLPPFPAGLMDDAHRVPGCQSQVWMDARLESGVLYLAGASDAAIVSGLVALLLRIYSGRTPAEILATDPGFLTDLGLIAALSTNRGNGVASMAQAIQAAARHAQEPGGDARRVAS